MPNLESLKYPIGPCQVPQNICKKQIEEWIDTIEKFPDQIFELTNKLSPKERQWLYRPNGWHIAQVVHHCADSHLNSFIRFKLALTENEPEIRPYFEDRWAKLPDANHVAIEDSLMLLKGLHKRWVLLLNSMGEDELNKTFIHPEHKKKISLKTNIGIYAWHCEHHLAHIKQAIKHQGEFN